MILTTTPNVDGHRITGYHGIVFGEVISGVNVIKDFAAGLSNFFGGRSSTYEDELMSARTQALQELEQRAAALGADAVVGMDASDIYAIDAAMIKADGTKDKSIYQKYCSRSNDQYCFCHLLFSLHIS